MVVGEPIRITIPSSQAKNGNSQGPHRTLQQAQTIGQQQFSKSSSINSFNEKLDSQATHQKKNLSKNHAFRIRGSAGNLN